MLGDKMRVLNELEVMTSTLVPEVDAVKLKIRYEEVLDNYNITRKSIVELEDDLINNIEFYISSKRLEGLSNATLTDYFRELVLMYDYIKKPTVSITTADIRSYLGSNEKNMISTTGKKLSVIKSFFGWLVEEDVILKNPAAKIRRFKEPKRLPKALSAVELEQIREACWTLRERAMIEVMFSTGCRLSEIAGMQRKQVDWIDGSLSVIGKGDKERIVYISPKASYHLKKYLEECNYGENDSDYLFSTERRPFRQLSNKSIQDMINKVAERTTVDKNVTPHVFRHTMATIAMDNGIELGDLQQLLGHENAQTTLRYATVSESRKKDAHKRFVQ